MALVDRPPPSRFAVVEKDGRLVVIDKESGTTPPTAAERMDAHDRALGVEPSRPAARPVVPDLSRAARAESGLASRPAPVSHQTVALLPRPSPSASRTNPSPMPAAPAKEAAKPWANNDRPAPSVPTVPAPARRPTARPSGQRLTIVTGKWWDAKGPRTIELGPLGQTRLRGGLWALAGAVLLIAVAVLFIAPIALLVIGFILFRFGTSIFAPIGASIIDKALAEPD